MIGAALAYPFVLARRRPVALLVAVLGVVVIAAALQVLSVTLMAAVAGVENGYQLAYVARYLAQTVTQSFPAGFLLAAALIDLDVRDPGRKPDLYDGLLVALISLTFAALITAPLYGAQWLFARAVTEQIAVRGPAFDATLDWMAIATYGPGAAWLAVALISGILFFRFSFSWPHALTTRRFVFFQAWGMSRGRFWRICSVLIPATLVALAASMAGDFIASWSVQSGIFGLFGGADDPQSIAFGAFRDTLAMLGAFYFNLANVYLYARLLPPKPEKVAEHFG